MYKKQIGRFALSLAILAGATACGKTDGPAPNTGVSPNLLQTRFPGQVTAGGGTSGEVLARSGTTVDGNYAGGTPGIAGGAGGNTGGAETGGTVRESGRGPTDSVAPTGSAQPR
jgi:hypothetical protein